MALTIEQKIAQKEPSLPSSRAKAETLENSQRSSSGGCCWPRRWDAKIRQWVLDMAKATVSAMLTKAPSPAASRA